MNLTSKFTQNFNFPFSSFSLSPGTLKTLLGLIAPDKSVKEICQKGDDLLLEETAKVKEHKKQLKMLWLMTVLLFSLPFSVAAGVQKREGLEERNSIPYVLVSEQLHLPFFAS